jgi:hypothetical protein
MSVAEMKLAAINEITKLDNEPAVKEILEHLEKLNSNAKDKFDTDAFFKKAAEQYGDVLQKLAE